MIMLMKSNDDEHEYGGDGFDNGDDDNGDIEEEGGKWCWMQSLI